MTLEADQRYRLRAGWWKEERATVYCLVAKDGQLVAFNRVDVEALMDAKYPHKGTGDRKRWFFNDTYDREIAEVDGEMVIANPNVLWDHYLPRT